MRFLLIALTFFLAVPPAFADTVCTRPLTVGYEDWAPFEAATDRGPAGINVAIHEAIAAKTGCELVWQNRPWKRVLRNIERGKADIANTASITPERRDYARFSNPYLPYEAILFLQADDTRQYDSLQAFLDAGNTLAITRGYTYGDAADALLDRPNYADQIVVTDSHESSVRGLAFGRVDGTVGNRYTLGHTAKVNGLVRKIRATDTVVQSEPVHFMFSKESVPQKVIDAFNDAITELKTEGTIQKIVNEHTGQAGS